MSDLIVCARMADIDCPESGEAFRGLEVTRNPSDAELHGRVVRLVVYAEPGERVAAAQDAIAWANGWRSRGAAEVAIRVPLGPVSVSPPD